MKRLAYLLLTIAFFACAHTAFAASYNLAPSKLDVRVKESFSIISAKLLQDQKQESLVDIVNTDTKDIKLYLLSNTSPKTAVEFITPEKPITVSAKSRISVPFTIKAGKNVADGEYIYYLYLSTNEKTKYSANVPSLQVVNIVGKKLEKKLEVSSPSFVFNPKNLAVSMSVKNTGTVTIDSLGIKLFLNGKIPLLTSNEEFYWGETLKVLPNETKKITYKIPYTLPLFTLSNARIEVDYAGKAIAGTTSALSYLNREKLMWYGISMAIIAAALIYLGKTKHLEKYFAHIKHLRTKLRIELPFFRPANINHFLHKEAQAVEGALKEVVASAAEADKQEAKKLESRIPDVGLDGLVKNIMKEEESVIAAKELSQEKILFEVRKIVRQEIELWKEIERFRTEVREQLMREELVKKRLKEELAKN